MSFKDLPETGCLSYQWDIARIERLIAEVVAKVQGFINLPGKPLTLDRFTLADWLRFPATTIADLFHVSPTALLQAATAPSGG